jgi:hypothetical protein
MEIHAAVFMSNHYHIDVTDPHAKLPRFKQLLNSLIARAVNATRKPRARFGGFWDRDAACDTHRPSDDETFLDLAYTIANPVTAGLVRHAAIWPGLTTAGWRFGETRSFKRPKEFFDPKTMPAEVSLTLVRPHVYPHLSDDQVYARLEAEVRRRELETEAKFRRESRRVVGVQKLRKQRWGGAPKSFDERFTVAPQVAASCKWKRLAQLLRNREWERLYAEARARLLAGVDVVFPAGTFQLRATAGVAVATC